MSSSKNTWTNLVSGKDLTTAKKLRNKIYITNKERALALSQLVAEGWELEREYKDTRFVSVKKEKPYDELFEDKVWILFASMGFTEMNRDRYFQLSYNPNPSCTQQIDVFAADNETVIVVECKSANTLRDGVFKKEIEAFGGQIGGLEKQILERYPGSKIKFIWATENYIMSRADLERLKGYGIVHFSDAIINYYLELVRHLGSCARYQLLGNLFADQIIKNMEEKIPAIEGIMGGHTYYSFSIEPEKLLKIGYVLHRNEANKNMMPTYQRLIKKQRLKDVHSFINKGGYFPNSLIISIDSKGEDLKFEPSPIEIDGSISKFGILHLPKRYRSAYIIDGQHRLYGYSDSNHSNSDCIPVVAFVDLERSEQIKLFMEINENQKAVPKTLRVTLNSDMLWESNDFNERRQALRSKIAQMLGEEETSPLLGRIVSGENETSLVKCITVEAIQSALKKCNFFTTYAKKTIISKDGTFDIGTNQDTLEIFYPFLEDCLRYIKNNCEQEWNKNDNEAGLIVMNRGIQAIIRVINDVINLLISRKDINPKKSPGKVFEEMKYYLDPLINFLNLCTDEQRKDLRGYFGGGADNRFWRAFQQAIADHRKDFQPEGLEEYWLSQKKTFNEDSIMCLREIKSKLKILISQKLEAMHGERWLVIGIPKSVYSQAKKEADDQNYDIVKSGENIEEVSILDCITISQCREIALFGRNWSEVFEKIFILPDELNKNGDKNVKTEWLAKLNTINNKLARSSYSVSTKEHDFIKKVYQWLIN